MLDRLPRSIRWRIQFGLLEDIPHSAATTNPDRLHNNANTTPYTNDHYPQQQQHNDDGGAQFETIDIDNTDPLSDIIHPTTSTAPIPPAMEFDEYYNQLQQHNQNNLKQLRQQYSTLTMNHYWKGSPLYIIQETEHNSPSKASAKSLTDQTDTVAANTTSTDATKKVNTTIEIQPADTKSSLVPAKSSKTAKSLPTEIVSDDPLSVMAMMEEHKSQSQKELMIQNRKEQALAMRNQKKRTSLATTIDSNNSNSNNSSSSSSSGDNNNTTSKEASQWNDFHSSRTIIDVIEKDLPRLPTDHHVCYSWLQQQPLVVVETHNEPLHQVILNYYQSYPNPQELQQYKQERSNLLSQILFVYAKENPTMGYRQGMHEIASLVLLTFELDFCNLPKKQQQQKEDESTIVVLLDRNKVVHDVYSVFDVIMNHLSPAYEIQNVMSGQHSPMELMGLSILNKLISTTV